MSLIAYGPTGSGKTHTISNLFTRLGTEVQTFVRHARAGGERVEIKITTLEIYNEQLRDLNASHANGSSNSASTGQVDHLSEQQQQPQIKLVHEGSNRVHVLYFVPLPE